MRLVADFGKSGLIQTAYARQVGLSDKLVSYWVRRVCGLRQSAHTTAPAATSPPSSALVHVADMGSNGTIFPVRTPPPTASAGLQRVGQDIGVAVHCEGRGLLVWPGFDRALLRELVIILEELPRLW